LTPNAPRHILRLMPKLRGFTLIELLITISLIGILSAIGTSTYTSAQQKGRDAQRKSDMTQIKKAMELAKSDCQGGAYYPVQSGSDEYTQFTTLQGYLSNSNLKYMNSVPQDPKNSGTARYGIYNDVPGNQTGNTCPNTSSPPTLTQTGGLNYMLRALLERGSADPDSDATFTKCAGKPGMPGASGGYYYVCND